MKTEKQKMLAGELYNGSDPELEADRTYTAAILRAYNFSAAISPVADAAFKALFAHFGDNSIIRAPFFCDYGSNIAIGHRVFLNFNCIILDVAAVTIGDDARIGPPSRSTPPTIPATTPSASRTSSPPSPSPSAATSGSVAERSSSPASPSATTPSSAPAASSPATSHRTPPSPAIPRAA